MKKRKSKPKKNDGGRKFGTERRDMRWIDGAGEVWDSKLESLVYEASRKAGVNLVRCDKTDTIPYYSLLRGASCKDCGGNRVGKARKYTPDFRMRQRDPSGDESLGYLEVKGYMRAPQRALFRSLVKEKPDLVLYFLIQSDFKVTSSLTFSGWIAKFLPGVKYAVWNGTFPTSWIGAKPRESKKRKRTKETHQCLRQT